MRVLKVKDALVKVKRPVKIPQSEYLPFGSYPVIDQGKSIIAGYTNDIESVIFSPLPMTIFGDHTRVVKFSKEPFASGADGTQLLYPIGDIDPTFFYYSIKNIDLSNYFYARHFKYLKESEICVPDLPVQRRIADILSAYDDLIENNRRRITILEETARLAYRKWFGGVEEGRTATLGEIADVVMGQSPESKTYNDNGEGLPFHQGVTGFGFRYPRNEMWCTAGTRFAEEGDILFSVRAPVGRINVAGERIVIGRGLSAMRAKNGFQSWLLYALKHHFSKEDMIGVGCIFASTTKKELLSVALPFPPDEEIASFEQIAGPIDAQIKALSMQNAALVTARDMLLPRLMKGFIN